MKGRKGGPGQRGRTVAPELRASREWRAAAPDPRRGELYRRAWDPVLDRLAVERAAISVDLLGHGDSPLMEEVTSPTPANFARLMAAFLRELGIEAAHIVGNSSGGWTALEIARLG